MTDRFDLTTADPPDAKRANDEALRFIGNFLRAKSAKDVDATMRFFSRDTSTYADGTLGIVFGGWDAVQGAYTSMMPHWGGGQSIAPSPVTQVGRPFQAATVPASRGSS